MPIINCKKCDTCDQCKQEKYHNMLMCLYINAFSSLNHYFPDNHFIPCKTYSLDKSDYINNGFDFYCDELSLAVSFQKYYTPEYENYKNVLKRQGINIIMLNCDPQKLDIININDNNKIISDYKENLLKEKESSRSNEWKEDMKKIDEEIEKMIEEYKKSEQFDDKKFCSCFKCKILRRSKTESKIDEIIITYKKEMIEKLERDYVAMNKPMNKPKDEKFYCKYGCGFNIYCKIRCLAHEVKCEKKILRIKSEFIANIVMQIIIRKNYI